MIHEETGRPRRGIVAGLIAGVVGIGCCVGPAVAALTGITSAAVAIDLANSLYSEWGVGLQARRVGIGSGGDRPDSAIASRLPNALARLPQTP